MAYIDSSAPRSPLAAAMGVDDEEEERGAGPGFGGEDPDQELEGDEDDTADDVAPVRKPGVVRQLEKWATDINIARHLSQQKLDEIGMTVVREFRMDENSVAQWADEARKAMKFALQQAPPKTSPWPNASNFIYPLIGQAALQFGATAYPAVIRDKAVVKGCVWGGDSGEPAMENGQPKMEAGPGGQPQPVWIVKPGEKQARADRISEHMSYQLLVEMKEWEPQTDQLLHQIPIIGGAARKTFYEPAEQRNYSLFVSLMNLVWDYNAPSFEAAQRHTEKLLVYPHEIYTNERTGSDSDADEGMWLELDYGPAGGDADGTGFNFDEERQDADLDDPDAPHMFIEQHRRLDLDDDGYAEPYIVTVHLRSGKVVRIVARYDEEGIHATKNRREVWRVDEICHYTLIPFLPSIDGGSYPMGFGHLLRPMNEGINTCLNQMFDAGTLQNAGGGFIGGGLDAASGDIAFKVGRYVRVTTRGQSIKDAVFPIPFPGPSTVLFQLLGTLLQAGKEIASIQAVLTGDAAMANAPPTTIMALIDQGMRLNTAITKRVLRAFKSEYDKLFALNKKHLTEIQRYQINDTWRTITPEDYRLGGGVEPVADPDQMTNMQRLGRAQILLQFKGDPTVRQDQIARRTFEAAGFDRIDDLMAPPDPAAQAMQALAVQRAQAELGQMRAQEQKDSTQAFFNLARARALASGPEEALIQQQMDFLRLKIEAVNAANNAAAIDHRFHDTETRARSAHADRLARSAELAADRAAAGGSGQPAFAPGPTGAFPSEPAGGPTGPAMGGPPAPGVQPVAPSPGDQGVPAIPG